jgi:ribonucleoside-diphosphate reductase, alpha subunit
VNHIELNNAITRQIDGFYDLAKDKEALAVYLEEVQEKTKRFPNELERLSWLVENDFYFDCFALYDEHFLKEITKKAYSYNFEFASYMAATKFYEGYALKTNDKKQYLENYEQHMVIVALYLAQGDNYFALELLDSLMRQLYQPATPTMMNAGRSRGGELVSCYLLSLDDSLNSINYNESVARTLSKNGGGVALNLSRLRARGESIQDVEGCAKGVLPVAKSLEYSFQYADQLGQRPGAGAVYLNVFHADLPEFLDTKKVNADEGLRLATISTGVIILDKFMHLARTNEPFYMFYPHNVFKHYGVHLDDMDMTKMYEVLVADPRIKKREGSAREILNQIAKMQLQSGYPYLMFRDNANKAHALKDIGDIKISNLCVEIQQLQEVSEIGHLGELDGWDIKRDISCNLGSLNIANVMEAKDIYGAVFPAMKALTAVSNMSHVQGAPGVTKANDELHSVGLGVMNLHGYLAKNLIRYDSEEAKEFADVFFAAMNYYSILASMHIARKTKKTFKDFDKSEYAKGEYFVKYTTHDHLPVSPIVKDLFEGIELPTREDWAQLARRVKKHGLYHAYRLAIAPTQSISYVQNATSSVMPIVDLIERRAYGNSETYYPMPFLDEMTALVYQSAYQIDQMKLIDLISVIQEHVDQGISTILYVNSTISTRELARLYAYAHHKGLKSLYYTRNKLLSVEECTSCSI